jgi:predicted DNA-binding protein with PD1-like motif
MKQPVSVWYYLIVEKGVIPVQGRADMKASEGRIGRVFVIRLEDGDVIPACIEKFAQENRISVGQVILVGGIGSGEVVVGPRRSDEMPPDPVLLPVDGAHEVAGVGVLAPDEVGKPVLHIHGALGRSGKTLTGCLRPGVTTWLVAEAVIYEILDVKATRIYDTASEFKLLEVD